MLLLRNPTWADLFPHQETLMSRFFDWDIQPFRTHTIIPQDCIVLHCVKMNSSVETEMLPPVLHWFQEYICGCRCYIWHFPRMWRSDCYPTLGHSWNVSWLNRGSEGLPLWRNTRHSEIGHRKQNVYHFKTWHISPILFHFLKLFGAFSAMVHRDNRIPHAPMYLETVQCHSIIYTTVVT